MDITTSPFRNIKENEEIEELYIPRKKTNKEIICESLRHIMLICISIVTFFPFIWMMTSSLKTKDEIFQFPPKLLPQVFNWSNFLEVFKEAPFEVYIGNSFFVATIIVAFQIIGSAMIAYALTQFNFKGRKILFAIIMGTYMLPSAATYVPCYMILSKINLIDTLIGIIISNLGNVFGIFLMRQAFLQINKSLIEAARIDGASHWKILWKIVFPLTKPTFITFGLISFVTYYNDYMYPSLITKSPEKFLISAGLRQFFIQGGAYGIKWPEIMAASTITVLPLLILFLVAQKWFMKGVGDTGVKE
ncbi:putative ABC transporter, permease component [Clostridium neonatale]|uniref:carbohydrate ABC transporter permease n=1 Tax=Clostridium neonatale TaxID=137838 RepID=UPI00291C3497|nr:carbohydrate ABC transporter permease [Clostridium neonatale]CAI3652255.1 putative ABC transporter, permease component [Clostridium neonatale]